MAALTDPLVHLRLVGVVLVGLGVVHALMPSALGWSVELAGLSRVNREVSYVHCGFIGLTCVLWGLLPLTAGDVLAVPHPVSRLVLVAAVVFWGARLVVQLGVFNPAHACDSAPWMALSVAATVLWAYVTVVWAWVLVGQFPMS